MEMKFITDVKVEKPANPPMQIRGYFFKENNLQLDKDTAHNTNDAILKWILLDTGSTNPIVNASFVKRLGLKTTGTKKTFELITGTADSNGTVEIIFKLPDLKLNDVIKRKFIVMQNANDPIIIGHSLMKQLGKKIDFENDTIEWDGTTSPIHCEKQSNEIKTASKIMRDEINAKIPMSVPANVRKQLIDLMLEFDDIFDGHIGQMKLPDYVIPVDDNANPTQCKPSPLPRSMIKEANAEFEALTKEGVLEQIFDAEWSSPAFFLRKPNRKFRLLTDFRKLNRYLKRTPFIPRIKETIRDLGQCPFIIVFDANKGYYARVIAMKSRSLTAFSLPFGKYRFARLPMGIKTAVDEYQSAMERILGSFDSF